MLSSKRDWPMRSRLTLVKKISGSRKSLYRCECGTEKEINTSNVNSGKVKSCGCYLRERAVANMERNADAFTGSRKTHGMFGSPTYVSWASMIQRCENGRRENFEYYGGRGIKVCAQWRDSFENFLSDMGERPANTSLDRIDNNGDYEPTNCRWSTHSEQCGNRRKRAEDRPAA